MASKLDTLTVERFRALRDLSIEGLGRVNLITGRNNSGKSSVLEALRILASGGAPAVIYSILKFREEAQPEIDESGKLVDVDGLFALSSLFHGFPSFSAKLEAISISAVAQDRSVEIKMRTGWYTEQQHDDVVRRVVSSPEQDLFGDVNALPMVLIETGAGGARRIIPLDNIRRHAYRSRTAWLDAVDEPTLPCLFVSPYGGEKTASLGALWDKIALSEREDFVVQALKIVEPGILALSMVGGEGPRQQRTAIVRTDRLPRPVPLRSFGDGLNRLFGIVLSLVNAKDGLLLIDEFENGMHHSVQLDAWRVIFKMSGSLGIQVFATSHSWDSIEAFQKAAAESDEKGSLIRLTRKGDEVVSTVFAEQELAVATRERIEVR